MQIEYDNWEKLLVGLNEKLGIQKNLLSVLFIIGLQEEGSGYKKYSQTEKTRIIQKAQFVLLRKQDYYISINTGSKEQEIWVENPKKDIPRETELEELLKRLSIDYFNKNQIQ